MYKRQASGSGSGVVYRVNGNEAYIITNAHVVEGANNVQVVFSNQESVTAEVLGSDSYSDIAVLKLTADFELKAINTGDSSLLDRGETVLAIGSPLGIEYAGTVTQGIVSGTDRTVSVDLNDCLLYTSYVKEESEHLKHIQETHWIYKQSQ